MRLLTPLLALILSAGTVLAQKVDTPPPTKPPLIESDIGLLPEGTDHLDLILLIGQSNMKGRGFMPAEPLNDPRFIMMHLRNDQWYHARHPLHLTGHPETFKGHDNAGVGPGLAFAQTIAAESPAARIGLLPCAKGGSPISLWSKNGNLYAEAIRRARLALKRGPRGKTRLRAVLWLQGEADSKVAKLPTYADSLNDLVDRLRKDLKSPDLPFIACTIGEMNKDTAEVNRAEMNKLLLDLPNQRKHTACVDARDLTGHIGDSVHFNTQSQEEIGRRYAAKLLELESQARD
ncbi:MAG: sialate O-acetylesterase [Verrucomicrobiales bacterium]|nr:sialate O-acetylesterase [Verrucomicrobiales bacterium]